MVMTQLERSKPVVVGIDGSQAAIDAAVPGRWTRPSPAACPFASCTSAPPSKRAARRLRTVRGTPNAPNRLLHRAEMTVHDMGRPVRVETAIVRGRADCVLIDESHRAAMVCVGSEGKGPCARMPLGSDRGRPGPACALPGSDRPVRRRAPDRQRLDRRCAKRRTEIMTRSCTARWRRGGCAGRRFS